MSRHHLTPGPSIAFARSRGRASWRAAAASFAIGLSTGFAPAATFGPPLLDITRQCSTIARRNVAAMSECVVAESEARAEILQKWVQIPDPTAEKCVKLGRQSKKYPYTTIAKCVMAEPASNAPNTAQAPRLTTKR